MSHKRNLKLIDIFCIATGAMISSGLFILPGIAHAMAGPAVVVSYFIAGLLAMTGMLSQAELISAMPKAGGTYFYVTRSMGSAAGMVDGFFTWISLSLKSSFAIFGLAVFISTVTPFDFHLIAVVLCFVFVGLSLAGIKGERGQVAIVMVVLAVLIGYISRGFPAVEFRNLEPFVPFGFPAVLTMAGFVFVCYGGLLKAASMAEDVEDPAKTIPRGMMLSLFFVVILYTSVVFVTSGVLGGSAMDNSLTPISQGAAVFLGSKGKVLLAVAAVVAFISTALAGIMAASRYPVALARDRLVPEQLAELNEKFKTPHYSILLTGALILASLLIPFKAHVRLTSTVLLLTNLFACLSVIIMRESRLQNYVPQFKAPLYPWTQVIGILGLGVLIYTMGRDAILSVAALMAGCVFLYWCYGRIRSNQEYALLHLVQRITAKELTTHSLETELKEIIRERDDIIKDRFDHIIEDSIVLDLKTKMGVCDFFTKVSAVLAPRLKMAEHEIMHHLLTREEESSTVIGPGIAIPHIVVEDHHNFDILLARCKPGIDFNFSGDKVQTVFLLIGSREERNFHLRALSAIAQIVQNKNFMRKWMAARSTEALRDIVLLGQRLRKP